MTSVQFSWYTKSNWCGGWGLWRLFFIKPFSRWIKLKFVLIINIYFKSIPISPYPCFAVFFYLISYLPIFPCLVSRWRPPNSNIKYWSPLWNIEQTAEQREHLIFHKSVWYITICTSLRIHVCLFKKKLFCWFFQPQV